MKIQKGGRAVHFILFHSSHTHTHTQRDTRGEENNNNNNNNNNNDDEVGNQKSVETRQSVCPLQLHTRDVPRGNTAATRVDILTRRRIQRENGRAAWMCSERAGVAQEKFSLSIRRNEAMEEDGVLRGTLR